MELSRRDALAALGAAAVATGGGVLAWNTLRDDGPLGPADTDRLVAVAETLYPDAVDGTGAFVERYVVGRVRGAPNRAAGIAAALDTLDRYAEAWAEAPFAALSVDRRDELLRSMGVDDADGDPGGSDRERVHHHLVDELLWALYATPTGGELLGIENPVGYPGGTTSYRRAPPDVGRTADVGPPPDTGRTARIGRPRDGGRPAEVESDPTGGENGG